MEIGKNIEIHYKVGRTLLALFETVQPVTFSSKMMEEETNQTHPSQDEYEVKMLCWDILFEFFPKPYPGDVWAYWQGGWRRGVRQWSSWLPEEHVWRSGSGKFIITMRTVEQGNWLSICRVRRSRGCYQSLKRGETRSSTWRTSWYVTALLY